MSEPERFTGVGEECAICGSDASYLVGPYLPTTSSRGHSTGGRLFTCGRHLAATINDAALTAGVVLIITPKGMIR